MEYSEFYREVAERLTAAGVRTHINGNNAFQLVCSAGNFSHGPRSSNSFWIYKNEASPWYLVTWSPCIYRVPQKIDIVELCKRVVECSKTTIYEVPEPIRLAFGLLEIEDDNDLPAELWAD